MKQLKYIKQQNSQLETKIILELFLAKVPIKVINFMITEHLFGNLDLKNLSKNSLKDALHLNGITNKDLAEDKFCLKSFLLADKELNLANKLNVKIVTLLDEEYPANLRNISNPPPLLYVKGSFCWQNTLGLAIVGSRKSDFYGKRVLDNIIPTLVSANFCIVSGGAIGIDALAHEIAIKELGKTIAITGTGIDIIYPQLNQKLFQSILDHNGCIISIFPLSTPPNKFNFPIRNRIIAGITEGTLVVQAAEKSGSLITAEYALSENRDVFAIPGNIDSPLSQGCNNLIKMGAIPTTTAQDIIDNYSHSKNILKDNCKKHELLLDNSLDISELEKNILNLIATPKLAEEIGIELHLKHQDLLDSLFELSLKGYATQSFNGTWQRT